MNVLPDKQMVEIKFSDIIIILPKSKDKIKIVRELIDLLERVIDKENEIIGERNASAGT